MFTSRIVSSLEKVFCEATLNAEPLTGLSAVRGETIAFQVAYCATENTWINVELSSDLKPFVVLREVGLVPCELPAMPQDPDALKTAPGLFPDPLLPMGGRVKTSRRLWHAIWVSVTLPDHVAPGQYPITVRLFSDPAGAAEEFDQSNTLVVEALPCALPEQALIATLWFHADCLHTQYRVPCWSEQHWALLEAYVRNAARHGVNMLLTPLWTPPLDTAVGHERPTTQLLEITRKNGHYHFDFHRLSRWMDMALDCGIRYFEFSHAFTQWGARFTPKIVVSENGVEKKVFGWHVAATDPKYRCFLEQLMPGLLSFIRGKGMENRCYFHVSDEPTEEQLASYSEASQMLRSLLEGQPVIDALSEVSFFDQGVIQRPVPVTDRLDDFMDRPLEQRWTYYCGGWDKVPNRQFGMPSARNRILGLLLYLYNLDGFLNWGFNFWYTQDSLNQDIDPFKVTDAGRAFCGGGSFMVYPGTEGPVDSIHYEVFREGLQDLRALRLLESRVGRAEVLRLVHEGLDYQIDMRHYPREARWLLGLREKVNQVLAAHTA